MQKNASPFLTYFCRDIEQQSGTIQPGRLFAPCCLDLLEHHRVLLDGQLEQRQTYEAARIVVAKCRETVRAYTATRLADPSTISADNNLSTEAFVSALETIKTVAYTLLQLQYPILFRELSLVPRGRDSEALIELELTRQIGYAPLYEVLEAMNHADVDHDIEASALVTHRKEAISRAINKTISVGSMLATARDSSDDLMQQACTREEAREIVFAALGTSYLRVVQHVIDELLPIISKQLFSSLTFDAPLSRAQEHLREQGEQARSTNNRGPSSQAVYRNIARAMKRGPNEALSYVLEELRDELGFDQGRIYMHNPSKTKLVAVYQTADLTSRLGTTVDSLSRGIVEKTLFTACKSAKVTTAIEAEKNGSLTVHISIPIPGALSPGALYLRASGVSREQGGAFIERLVESAEHLCDCFDLVISASNQKELQE